MAPGKNPVAAIHPPRTVPALYPSRKAPAVFLTGEPSPLHPLHLTPEIEMAEKFEAWGIVELMGHQRTAGRLSEQMIAGANLLRVDLPQGEGDSFRTMFYGPSAIYAVHITDEQSARAVAAGLRTRPVYAYEIDSHLRKLAAPSRQRAEVTDDFDDDQPY